MHDSKIQIQVGLFVCVLKSVIKGVFLLRRKGQVIEAKERCKSGILNDCAFLFSTGWWPKINLHLDQKFLVRQRGQADFVE